MKSATPTAGVPKVRVIRGMRAGLAYQLNRLALAIVTYGYVPAILLLVAAMGYGEYALLTGLIRHAHKIQFLSPVALAGVVCLGLFVLVTSLLLLLGLVPLFFRRVERPDYGLRLTPKQHPNLFALLQRLCQRLNTPTPDVCVLTPSTETAVAALNVPREDGTIDTNVRVLYLGAAHIVHCRVSAFATIICHELAHAALRDTQLSHVAYRLYNSLVAQVMPYTNDDQTPWLNALVRCLASAYYHVFALVYLADSRFREYRADRISAEICGPQNARNALITTSLAAYIPELDIQTLWLKCLHSEEDSRNLYAEHRRRWEQVSPARREHAETAMFMARASVWDTHPSLTQRVRNLANVEARELVSDQPATKLFRNWEVLEEKLTSEIMRFGKFLNKLYIDHLGRQIRMPG